MYIDIDNILPTVGLALVWYIILAIPSGVWVLLLTLHGKRIGKVPADADTQHLVFVAMVTWPKIYYLTILGALRIATDFLWKRASEESKSDQTVSEQTMSDHIRSDQNA